MATRADLEAQLATDFERAIGTAIEADLGDGVKRITRTYAIFKGDQRMAAEQISFIVLDEGGGGEAAYLESVDPKDTTFAADVDIYIGSGGHGFHTVEVQQQWSGGCKAIGIDVNPSVVETPIFIYRNKANSNITHKNRT